jgi:hypothetical protein
MMETVLSSAPRWFLLLVALGGGAVGAWIDGASINTIV